MHVGLVTPPGLLGSFVASALSPAGHSLTVATGLEALAEQSEVPCEVVLFAPLVEGKAAWTVLADARARGEGPAHAIYLGLDAEACELARKQGFDRALALPFQGQELAAALERSAKGTLRILLADDSPLIHRHTVPILDEAGYAVVEAFDGAEALEQVRRDPPDLVLTDIEMPRMSGYELCKAIKAEEATAHIPVVMCSSLGEAADLEKGFDVGADDYLVKPVVAEELVSRVQAILATKMASSRERVLVVDDSAAIRHLVADCLRRQGFVIETAVDGKDGLSRAEAVVPDLVLTDYDMPHMTGFELVHALRRDLRTRDVPIVMLTARDTKRDQAQMRAAGLTSYLVKPFSTDKCVAIVERVLAEARLRRYKLASKLYISEGAALAAESQASTGEMYAVRAKEVEATLLFSDIAGFTVMSSRMSPREIVGMLNEAFDALCPVIKAQGGDIDKFIGDAIMAVFEDHPSHDEPHALRAARAAWGMQEALRPFAMREPPLTMRVGLNAGPIVRGDIGSRFVRRDYTCIGDTVNRAQRHESMAPKGGVLLSDNVYACVKDFVIVEEILGIKLKGIDVPVSAYVLKGFR
jgi:DNA-binding response OmpR family regulator